MTESREILVRNEVEGVDGEFADALAEEAVLTTPELSLEQIMDELHCNRGYFPHEALLAAMANPELVTPSLLKCIGYATENAGRILEKEPDYMAHLYAMYLLAQFREKSAYPLVASFASLPGELALDITGDFVTEDLGRVLASVSGGDQSLIRKLIEDDQVNEYVRDQALHALLCLVADGQADRDEVVAYFGELLRGKLERSADAPFYGIVHCAMDLYPEEIREDIRKAFAEGLIDRDYISLDYFEQTFREDKQTVLAQMRESPAYRLIGNVIEETKWWACFQDPDEDEEVFDDYEFESDEFFPERYYREIEAPIRREEPKVGRNDPCPCGSGKKYKKCCGK